jgi:hypothetical protein
LATVTLNAYNTSWKDDLKRSLVYAERLKHTDPKLCMQVLIDILGQVVDRLP